MCLSVALHRPDDVLSKGEHLGFQWMTVHNCMGYRCGYIRLPQGHPWHGMDDCDVPADVHGGITFSEADEPCDAPGPDTDWWIGFDCAHAGDAPDPSLPGYRAFLRSFGTIRTQSYVEAECRRLCEQAAAHV